MRAGVRFMLLHDQKNDDGIRAFMSEVHENYIKVLMNPFHDPDDVIHCKHFDAKVRAIAKRHL